MLEKDTLLEKIRVLVIFFLVFLPNNLIADDIKIELINYNKSLKNSSALFMQTDGKSVEEGIIYFGDKRIRVDYTRPKKITLILSKKRGVYINHELKETQHFNTNKSYVGIFFKIFNNNSFSNTSNIVSYKDKIEISEKLELEKTIYIIKIIYENKPIKLRKIEVVNENESLDLGFFNHNIENEFKKKFFSMVDPYLN